MQGPLGGEGKGGSLMGVRLLPAWQPGPGPVSAEAHFTCNAPPALDCCSAGRAAGRRQVHPRSARCVWRGE